MKKLLLFIFISGIFSSFAFADCSALASKYEAPDPASKTMNQIKRWVKRKVKDASEATELENCLIAGAADNPNKTTVAGK